MVRWYHVVIAAALTALQLPAASSRPPLYFAGVFVGVLAIVWACSLAWRGMKRAKVRVVNLF